MQLRDRTGGFVRTEGGLLPADLLERIRALDRKLPGLDEGSYRLANGERFGEAITRSWNRLVGAWTTFSDELASVSPDDPATSPTRERWLLPLMEELGYGRLSPVKAVEIDGKSYPVSHAFATIPLHLVGANVPLDRRSKGVAGAAGQSPHGLLQEFLNRSPDRLWGLVTNGRILRILRDNASLTRQAYVEFDLEAILSGEAYADFALLWHLAHCTRLAAQVADGVEEGAAPSAHGAYLEHWSKIAEETGARARDRLRDGVQEAIEALGSGFLAHAANGGLRADLQAGELTTQDYYRELLRLIYRLILLFVAEDRDLLLDPAASPVTRERYTRYYSTARIRRLAERRKGSRHADFYAGLRVVITALGSDEGAPGIGLPPLGGFLFGADACPHLDRAELANGDLLDAVRKLATIEERGGLRAVDYRNLGSEELGSIYESLLELHPEVDVAAPSFVLRTAAGHERKTTGSYYTPSSLISVLLDSALDPVLAEAADKPTKEEAERAILELSVVDPAAGSGHFLVAAAHRIAKRLAQVRTEDDEPAPTAITTALRDVIGHCLYAVDVNPMAVELCKVSLWLDALEPGKPLSFLDAHIKCGNSLLGTTAELVEAGIPDAAYDPITGDDKAVARALRARNAAERAGQQSLLEGGFELPMNRLAAAVRDLERTRDDDLAELRSKDLRHQALLASADYTKARRAADAWAAAFVAPKIPDAPELTTGAVRTFAADPRRMPTRTSELVQRLTAQYGFFHWPVEFPLVFAHGGFDLVLGNPPWERVKLQEKEFFAERSPAIADSRNAATRKRKIRALERDDLGLWRAFQDALRQSDGESHLLRDSGRYPLTGRGDINTYAVFAEAMRSLVGPRGRAGIVVPTGIATDDTTKHFFGDLVDRANLASLYSFENEDKIFPGVHNEVKFCLLTMTGRERTASPADFVFFARQTSWLADPARHFTLTPEEFELLNPNTRTCPTFRSHNDAEIAKAVYRRIPVLVRESDPDGNPWGVSFLAMFHMANDSGLFRDVPGKDRVPLYEAKMVHQFDHRSGTYAAQTQAQANKGVLPQTTDAEKLDPDFANLPHYWVDRAETEARLAGRWDRGWLLGWRDITNSVAVRTAVASAVPRAATADTLLLAFSDEPSFPLIIANFNSFALDWVARQKVGGAHLKYHVLKQMAFVGPGEFNRTPPWAGDSLGAWLRPYVVELVYTSWDLEHFARDLGWDGPPFPWDAERRSTLRAEIDAAFFHLYGMARSEVEHVMDSFWIVRNKDEKEHGRYRTKSLILDSYDAMGAATLERPFVTRLSPGPGNPAIAHRPRSGEESGRWIPWEDVSRRAPQRAPSSSRPDSAPVWNLRAGQ